MSGPAARAWRFAGALCGLIVLLDQATKAIVEANLVPRQRVDVLGPLELTNSHNNGVAFGLAGGGGLGITLLTLAALGLIVAIFARDPQRRGIWVTTGLLAGGALGNLADRVRIDAVTDFIDLPAWPPFNVADVAITCGVAILAWSFLRETP